MTSAIAFPRHRLPLISGSRRVERGWRLAAGLSLMVAVLSLARSDSLAADGWRAGVAAREITPTSPMWMSGYASRDHEAEGQLTPLWTKVLVLEDTAGSRAALVTLDLVGIDRQFGLRLKEQLASNCQLPPHAVALCCSHTHTGPVVGNNLRPMYGLTEQQNARVGQYTADLEQSVVAAARDALAALAPAQIAWGSGQATFAVNRRNNPEPEVPERRTIGTLVGPNDHDVPVLAIRDLAGQLRAVVAGYACHATTLGHYQWSGDYPGFYQIALQRAHPEALAFFWAGCGGDQNPLPRRTTDLAAHYGQQLAEAVERVLAAPMAPLAPRLQTSASEIPLPFAHVPTEAELRAEASGSDVYHVRRANMLLADLAAGRPVPTTYPYPLTAWRLGGEVDWVFLGGEVVVDYALRLKSQLAGRATWVAGYSHDVMAYIPSRRVLAEGGYEGGGAMVYYGLPSAWTPDVEQQIIDAVTALTGQHRAAP